MRFKLWSLECYTKEFGLYLLCNDEQYVKAGLDLYFRRITKIGRGKSRLLHFIQEQDDEALN